MHIFKKHKEKNFDYFIIFIILLFGLKTLFFEENYIAYDELYSLINYTNIYTLFLKDNLNNHVINSLVGIVVGNFTYEINFLRLFSYLSFFIGLIFLLKNQISNKKVLIILLFLLISNNFFVYSFLYRGYPYYFLLFCLAFYLLSKKDNYKASNYTLIIFATLTFLAPSNVLLIFPIIFFYRNRFKLKNIILFYIFLTPVLLSSHIILTGIYELREVIEIRNITENIFRNPNLIIKIFFEGSISYYNLIFGFYQDRGIFDHVKIFLRDDKLILILYLIFFINIILKLFKKIKLDNYDKIFISKLMLFLVLSNAPFARIYYPFYAFYILYLDRIISESLVNVYLKKVFLNFIKIILVIILFFNFSLNKKLTENYDISIHYNVIKNKFLNLNLKKNKCHLDKSIKTPLSKDIYIYKSLIECKKKIDIFEIKNFQKI